MFSFITVCCLEEWRPPLSPWADFQDPRALGRMHRGSGHCSSLKNKDNLKDGWENLIPLLEKMRPIPSSGTPQGRKGILRGRTWLTAWGQSVRQGHRVEQEGLDGYSLPFTSCRRTTGSAGRLGLRTLTCENYTVYHF